MIGGVYQIRNTITDDRYVGRAISFARREAEHKKRLRGGRHSSPYLQNAWNHYGAEAFSFEPLVLCDAADAVLLEQHLLDAGKSEYNVSRSAWTPVRTGDKRPAEVVAKMSAGRKGKPLVISPEGKERRRASLLGNRHRRGVPHSAAARAKMSEARRGKRLTAEHCKSISAAAVSRPRSDQGRWLSRAA
jgi:group I intron endonuclease